MGILGFQKFQTEEVVGGSVKVKMVDKIAEWKSAHPNRQPIIAIRFKELLLSVIQLNVRSAYFGGCHQQYYQQLDAFFKPFIAIGAKFVLFGGGVKDHDKLNKLCHKDTRDHKRYLQLLKDIDKRNDFKAGARAEFRERLGLHEECLAIQYGEYRFSTGDLNKDIVQFARSNENVVAVLAKDSDFLVYNMGDAIYWSCGIDELRFMDMTTNAFDRKAMVEHTQLTPYQFHIMVALLAVVQEDSRKHLPNAKFDNDRKTEATGSIKIIYDICECVKGRVPAELPADTPSQLIDFKALATEMFARNVNEYCALIKKQYEKYNVLAAVENTPVIATAEGVAFSPKTKPSDKETAKDAMPSNANISAADPKQGASEVEIPQIVVTDSEQSMNAVKLDDAHGMEPKQDAAKASCESGEPFGKQEATVDVRITRPPKCDKLQLPAVDKADLQLAFLKNKNIFTILHGDVIHLKLHFIDASRLNNRMTYPNLYSLVFRRAMGAVLNSVQHTELRRKVLMKPSDAENYKVLGKYLLYPNFEIPSLQQLIDTDDNDDEELMQKKWYLFMWILHMHSNTKMAEKFRKVSTNILPTIITAVFLLNERHITQLEADTIILSDYASINGSYDAEQVSYPAKVNGRTIRVAQLYIHTRVMINRCLQICGLDLFKVPVYFNGVHFHNLLDKYNDDVDLFEEEMARTEDLEASKFLFNG